MNPHRQSEIIWRIVLVLLPIMLAAGAVLHLLGVDQ
jgi:hypothetical protein